MIRYSCPACGQSIEVAVAQGGEQINCTSCGVLTTVPAAAAIPVPVAPVVMASVNSVAVPVLISAIGNVISFYFWFFTCVGIFFAVPMAVLCVFEFIFYSQAQRLSPQDLSSRATTLGICEIVVGLFNLVSLVCGIIVVVNASRLRGQIPQPPEVPSSPVGSSLDSLPQQGQSS